MTTYHDKARSDTSARCFLLVLCPLNTYTFVASILGSGEARRGSIPAAGCDRGATKSRTQKRRNPGRHVFFHPPIPPLAGRFVLTVAQSAVLCPDSVQENHGF